MTSDDIYRSAVEGFGNRKFAAGLLVAFIDFLLDLDAPSLGSVGLTGFLDSYPRQELLKNGKRANTLVVARGDGSTVSIRPYYNKVELYFRSEHSRFDYPSCAPHATQAWRDYEEWLDGLCRMSRKELESLRVQVCRFVLDTLPDQSFDPESVKRHPPVFEMLLSGFELTSQGGEPTGAAFQGIVFGFLRADNPHLQVEVDKVRTGSKRLQRVGDIDGWDGARLAVTAEVKQYSLSEGNMEPLRGFFREANHRGAIGIVAALDFDEGARNLILDAGLHPVSQEDMLRIVGLWDPAKQDIAAASFLYYAHHVEKNSGLIKRLGDLLEGINVDAEPGEPAIQPPMPESRAGDARAASPPKGRKSRGRAENA